MRAPQKDRFWAKVNKTDGCWEWTGSRLKKGYGRLRVNKKFVIASRMAYQLTYGPIPDGMIVCHRCDNPPCVRPDHLFLGTHQDNIDDMYAKGRRRKHTPKIYPPEFGETNPEEWRRQVLENFANEQERFKVKRKSRR